MSQDDMHDAVGWGCKKKARLATMQKAVGRTFTPCSDVLASKVAAGAGSGSKGLHA